jgi:tRNA(Ile)-lysidine synthase
VAAPRKPPAVARVLQQVTATARKHGMFEPPGCVVVAVSGGPDSLCLLHALVRVRRLFRIEPVCFHFDHRLREGSETDAAYVRRQADRLGIPFVLRTASSKPGRGQSVEAWARTVRYEALKAVVEEYGGGVAAVGHTADDQAETILMALLQGSGLEALAGMRPLDRPIARPLLEVSRDQTEAFCRSLGLRPRRDPMNEELARLRVSVRTRLLPMTERALGRNVREAIARTGAHLREDADLLESMATALAAGIGWDGVLGWRQAQRGVIGRPTEDGYELKIEPLEELPPSISHRLVRMILFKLGIRPEASHVEAVLSLIEARPGARASLPGALIAKREKGYVRVSRPSPA